MSVNIEQGTDANFDNLINQPGVPLVVDFWAPWCGPCRMVGPILEELADEYQGQANVVKVNVDEERQVAGAMGIRSIPTIALFKDGEVKDVIIGARPKADFKAMLEKALEN